MIIRNFALSRKRIVGELDTFELTIEARDAGATVQYTFQDCSLCDTDLVDETINASKPLTDEELDTFEDYLMDVLSHDEIIIGLDGNIAQFGDTCDDNDVWAAIRFKFMTAMEV